MTKIERTQGQFIITIFEDVLMLSLIDRLNKTMEKLEKLNNRRIVIIPTNINKKKRNEAISVDKLKALPTRKAIEQETALIALKTKRIKISIKKFFRVFFLAPSKNTFGFCFFSIMDFEREMRPEKKNEMKSKDKRTKNTSQEVSVTVLVRK